jgi:hypothetical protein
MRSADYEIGRETTHGDVDKGACHLSIVSSRWHKFLQVAKARRKGQIDESISDFAAARNVAWLPLLTKKPRP